jgi:hypothetical protein
MPGNYRSGVTGRYQLRCGHGLCALTGDQASSKLQGSLFALLDYVVGGGRQDVSVVLGGQAVRLDMVFDLPATASWSWSTTARTGIAATRNEISSRAAAS